MPKQQTRSIFILLLILVIASGIFYFTEADRGVVPDAVAKKLISAKNRMLNDKNFVRLRRSIAFSSGIDQNEGRSGRETIEVTFRYEDPLARHVLITGEFNDWELEPMVKNGPVWMIKKNVYPNIDYAYQFIVDGKWIADPGNINMIERGTRGTGSLLLAGTTDNHISDAAPMVFSLHGRVTDKRGAPLSDVIIKISQNGNEYVRLPTTKDGTYSSENVPIGKYEIKAWKLRYKPEIITIQSDKTSSRELNFVLYREERRK